MLSTPNQNLTLPRDLVAHGTVTTTRTPVDADPLLSLAQICSMFPGSAGKLKVCPSTVCRWITRGVRTSTGRRVYLRGERIGYRWVARVSAIRQFQATLTETALPEDARTPTRTPAQARAAALKANEELIAAGC